MMFIQANSARFCDVLLPSYILLGSSILLLGKVKGLQRIEQSTKSTYLAQCSLLRCLQLNRAECATEAAEIIEPP